MGAHRMNKHGKPADRLRYVPPAVLLFAAIAFSLFLSGGPPAHRLSIQSHGVENFIASHLHHADGFHLSATILVLFVAGFILEKRWGTPRFVAFFAFTALGSAVVTLATAAVLRNQGASCGASGVALGALVALGFAYPDVKLTRWAPQTKHLVWAVVFLGIAGLAFIDKRHAESAQPYFLFPQASGTVFALAFIALDPWFARRVERWKMKRDRERRDRVVAIRHRVDDLLEKITAQGFESLTRDEQSFLRQASKHYKAE